MSDTIQTRDDNGDLALRTVASSGDNGNEKNTVYTRDDNGNLCVRIIGSGGGGGGGSTEKEIVEGGTITLENNVVYSAGELASFTVAFPATADATFVAETDFTSGATATTLTYPLGVKWTGDDLTNGQFVPKASKRYNVIWWYDGVNWNANASART